MMPVSDCRNNDRHLDVGDNDDDNDDDDAGDDEVANAREELVICNGCLGFCLHMSNRGSAHVVIVIVVVIATLGDAEMLLHEDLPRPTKPTVPTLRLPQFAPKILQPMIPKRLPTSLAKCSDPKASLLIQASLWKRSHPRPPSTER